MAETLARKINRLSELKIQSLKKPGYYADGAGLCLQITGSDAALADQWESTLASYVSPVLDPSPSLPLIPDS